MAFVDTCTLEKQIKLYLTSLFYHKEEYLSVMLANEYFSQDFD